MAKYQSKNVTVLRDAKQGDAGFVAGSDQILIKLEDGSQKVVSRRDVVES
jgi:hypothetical protein